MKLSTKLIIGMFAVLLCIVLWQAVISHAAIGDIQQIKRTKNSGELLEVLKESSLYKPVDCDKFNYLVTTDKLNISIYKSSKLSVFINKYLDGRMTLKSVADTLKIDVPISNGMNISGNSIFIFMPEELLGIIMSGISYRTLNIFGFDGNNTQILLEKGACDVKTDMAAIQITQQNDSYLYLGIESFGSSKQIKHTDLTVHSENSNFNFNDNISATLNASVYLDNSRFSFSSGEQTHVGNLIVKGHLVLSENENDWRSNNVALWLPCDSLLIDLDCSGLKSFLNLQGSKGTYESIRVSDNIAINRGEKKE